MEHSTSAPRQKKRSSHLGERYHIERLLGRGGGGKVYQALDRITGQRLALKQPHQWSQPAREFATVARLGHPNVVQVMDLDHDKQGRPFFTMELLPGAGDEVALRGLDPERFYLMARDLLRGLHYLHSQGVVHADLKPANIYLPPRGGAARLMDFGLAVQAHQSTEAPRGTLTYMAPETLNGHTPSPQSDLYSLGAVFYEALVGKPPFEGDPGQILQAKLEGYTPRPGEQAPDIPAGMDEIITTLMQPTPQGRYRSAAEVCEALAEATQGLPEASLVDWSLGALAGRARLVERGPVLHQIARALGWEEALPQNNDEEDEEDEEPCVSVLWVQGEPGVGCSRLLREAALQAQLAELRVVHLSVEAQVCTLDALTRVLGLKPATERLLHDEDAAERRTWLLEQVLDEMLRVLGQSDPILLVLDGGHLLDPLTFDWLRVLARRPDQTSLSCLVGGHHSTAPPRGVERLGLSPLSQAGLAQLLWNHLGVVDHAEELATRLWTATGGNPTMAEDLLRFWIDRGALRLRTGRWYPDLAALDQIAVQPDTGQLQAQRLASLSRAEHQVLGCAAVLGRRGPRALLDDLCPQCGPALSALESAGLLRTTPGAVLFDRAMIWQATYDSLDPETRRELHRRALTRLRTWSNPPPADMARHARGVGLHAETARWARQAAALASQAQRHSEAIHWLEEAVRATETLDKPQLRHELLRDLSQAYEQQGQPQQAEEALAQVMLELREHDNELLLQVARLRLAQGNYEGALEICDGALPDQEAQAHQFIFTQAQALSMLARYQEVKATLEPLLEHARQRDDHQTAARALVTLGTVACHDGRHEEGAKLLQKALERAKDAHSNRLQADAWLNLGTALRYRGDLTSAGDAYRAASRLYQLQGLLAGAAKGQNNEGVVAYLRGRWGEAQRCWEDFQETVERLGLAHECVHAYNNLGTLYKDRGELEKAVRTFHKGVRLARDIQYSRFEAMLLGNLGEAMLRLERYEDAEVFLHACRKQAVALDAQGELIEVDRRLAELKLAQGELAAAGFQALQVLQEGEQVPGVEQGHLLRIAGSAELEQGNLEDAARHLEESRRHLERQGARYELAMTLIAEGRLQLANQDPLGSLRTLDRAIQLLEPLGARRELKLAREAMRLAQQDRRQSGGDASRLRMVLDVARKLGPLQSLSLLLNAVLDVALEVTHHERGFVLLYRNQHIEMTVARHISPTDMGSDSDGPSRTVAQEVARTRRSLGSVNLMGDARFNEQASVMAMGLRSVRCVPILLGDRLLGVIYVDSGRIDREETIQEELELLEALASLAAMALENARLLAEERRKADLIAKTAHEISRPLAAIQGFAHDLNRPDSEIGADERRSVRLVVQQAERLARLTQHMVDLGRMEAADVQLHIKPTPAQPLLSEAIDALEPLWQRQQQHIALELPTHLPDLLVDRDRIIQVLTNLLGNAIKFAPQSGNIKVSAQVVRDKQRRLRGNTESWSMRQEAWEEDRDPEHMIQIAVEDNGPGVPAKDREAIFEPFIQRSTDPAQRRQGAGLGLAITREIVHSHGGGIWAEDSQSLGGARVCFTLPLMQQPQDSPPAGEG